MDPKMGWALTVAVWTAALAVCWRAFRRGVRSKSTLAWMLFGAGWAVQFLQLYRVGLTEGRCPIRTLPEIFTFLSWAVAAVYLVINLVYNSNALACYATPVTLAFQGLGLFIPSSAPVENWLHSSWLGFHASFSVLAYAAFSLSAILATMFLWEEWQLKNHRLSAQTMAFPAVGRLELWMTRTVSVGFVLFSAGLLAGFLWFEALPAAQRHHDLKIGWALSVWAAYFALIVAHKLQWIRRRNAAWLYIALTAITVLSFWQINLFSTYHNLG